MTRYTLNYDEAGAAILKQPHGAEITQILVATFADEEQAREVCSALNGDPLPAWLVRELNESLDGAGSHGDRDGASVIERAIGGDADALADYLGWEGAWHVRSPR